MCMFFIDFSSSKKSWCFSLRVVCCLNIWMYLLRNKICQRCHHTWFHSSWFFILLRSVDKLEINVIWYWFSNGIILLILYDYLCLFVCFTVVQGYFKWNVQLSGIHWTLIQGHRLLCVCAYEWMLFVNYQFTYVVMWN